MADEPLSLEIDASSLLSGVDGLTDDLRTRLANTLFARAEAVMARAKDEFVPVDQGVLRASGYVVPPTIDAEGTITVVLGFGGPAADYARVQHERTDFHHPSLERQKKGETSGQGTDHYLQKPLMDEAPDLPQHLAAAVKG